jgi:hypothetical protein
VSSPDTTPEETSAAAQQFAFAAVRATLGKSTDVDSCVALTTRIDVLIEQALGFFQKEGEGLACRAGCSFCCHLRVMVYPHEAIALYRYLGSRMPKELAQQVRLRIMENAAKSSGEDHGVAKKTACAFLIDGKCSAYEVRPGACAGYHSTSWERCEESFNATSDSPGGIPMLKGLHHVVTALDAGMDAALKAGSLSGERAELHTALAALVRNPTLIERWRAGRALRPLDSRRGGGAR